MNQNYSIAIMSFNRPHYLEPVLKALSEQVDCRISKRPIFLFQDGAVNLIRETLNKPSWVARIG
jgi:hypothetical protein